MVMIDHKNNKHNLKKKEVTVQERILHKTIEKHKVFTTSYGSMGGGTRLQICTNCGEMYCYHTYDDEYIMPIRKKLSQLDCVNCGVSMLKHSRPYPKFFFGEDGVLYNNQYIGKNGYGSPGRVIRRDIEKQYWNLYTVENEEIRKEIEEKEKHYPPATPTPVPGMPGLYHVRSGYDEPYWKKPGFDPVEHEKKMQAEEAEWAKWRDEDEY